MSLPGGLSVLLGLVCLVAVNGVTVSTKTRVWEGAENEALPPYTPEIVDTKGQTVTGSCFKCNISKVMVPNDDVKATVWTPQDYEEFRKNPAQRTANILRMLDEIRSRPHHGTLKDIEQMTHLLGLYRVLKEELIQTMRDNHQKIPVLPSEEKTYIDASGRHWGDAEMKDSLQEVLDQRTKDIEKEKAEMAAEKGRLMAEMQLSNDKAVDGDKPVVKKVPDTPPAMPIKNENPLSYNENAPALPNASAVAAAGTACGCAAAPAHVACPCRPTYRLPVVRVPVGMVPGSAEVQKPPAPMMAAPPAVSSCGCLSAPAHISCPCRQGGAAPLAPFGTPTGIAAQPHPAAYIKAATPAAAKAGVPVAPTVTPVAPAAASATTAAAAPVAPAAPAAPVAPAAPAAPAKASTHTKGTPGTKMTSQSEQDKITFQRAMATPNCPCGCPTQQCPCRCTGARFFQSSPPMSAPVVRRSVAPPAHAPVPADVNPKAKRKAVKHGNPSADCKPPLCFTG